MRVVSIERVMVSAEDCGILEKAKDILDSISLCGTKTSDEAVEIADNLEALIDSLIVCEADENSAFVKFADDEITDYSFDFEDTDETTETETE
jgi:hypothetical protein